MTGLTSMVLLFLGAPAQGQSFTVQNGWMLEPQASTFYENGVGSPAVLYDANETRYVMFFETRLAATDSACPQGMWGIGAATSADGLAWSVVGSTELISPTASTFYSCVAAHPAVILESSGDYGVYFKAEQVDDACSGTPPAWGCSVYPGVGYAAIDPTTWAVTVPRTSPDVAVGADFGFPTVAELDGTRFMLLSRRPELFVASSTDKINWTVGSEAAVMPGATSWTRDEIFNPALVCDPDSAYAMETFVGGRLLSGSSIVGGGWGLAISDDADDFLVGASTYFSIADGNDWRHWDVLRVGSEYLAYFSEKNGSNQNRIGFAATTGSWDAADISDRYCTCERLWYVDADGDGYGHPVTNTPACLRPAGYAALPSDCDDGDGAQSPGTDTCPSVYYLHNDPSPPTGNTVSHTVLTADTTAPTATTLYNYDTNRDGEDGLHIKSEGSGASETDTTKTQVWRVGPLAEDLVISGTVTLDFWAASKEFEGNKTGQFKLYLRDYNGASHTEIGNGSVTDSTWNASNQWARHTIDITGVSYTVDAGDYLEIKIIVGSAAEDDMMFTYDTAEYPTLLRVP